MHPPTGIYVALFLATLALPGAAVPGFAQEDLDMRGWNTIPAEELAAQAPRVDPHAHAEFTYRELLVDDSSAHTTRFAYHYRAKIYTEEGVKRWDKVDIPYETGWRIAGIKARVVHPDGSVVVLKNRDVYKRRVFKEDKFTGYARSFSFPGLQPGSIVEYQWSAYRAFWLPSLAIPLRAEWPTWHLDVSIRSYSGLARMHSAYHTQVAWDKKGSKYNLSLNDLPAASDKPFLAPRKDFEPWVYLEYAAELKMLEREDYWGYRGGALVELNKDFVKPKKKEVKKLAERLFEGLVMDEDKLRAAYDYCASEIVNIQEYTTKYSEQEIEDLKRNRNVNDTIKNGYGTRYDINAVFASLAALAGFTGQLAAVEDHQEFTYNVNAVGGYNLTDWVVAVGYGVDWRYFDPGSSFLPFEVLNPRNADATTLQTDGKFYYIKKTPPVAPEVNATNRVAEVTINSFGDLEGVVKIQYNGYAGLELKRLFATMSESELKDYLEEEEWQTRFARASVDNIEAKYADSREEPLVMIYDIKIPGFADVLQDRIIFKPSIFEAGKLPLFPDETREEPIFFDYQFVTNDKIVFRVPDRYVLETQYSVNEVREGAVLDRKSMATIDQETGELIYRRSFVQKLNYIHQLNYPVVKGSYDYVNEVDSSPIGLVRDTSLALGSGRL